MLKTIQNWFFKQNLLLKKKNLLYEIEFENIFLSVYFEQYLNQDSSELLKELEAMRKDPLKAGSPDAQRLQAKIVEIETAKSRLKSSGEAKHQLETYIQTLKAY